MPQGTVKSFDNQTQTGSLVLDDMTEVTYDAYTFAASRLLELRIGQRVRFDFHPSDDEGDDTGQRVTNLQIVSL